MIKRSYLIMLICIALCLCMVSYYIGSSITKDRNKLSEFDFNATFCEYGDDVAIMAGDYPYISIEADEKKYHIFYVKSREIISEGNCTIEDNMCIMKGDGRIDVIVYTDEQFFWIDNEGTKHPTRKVSSAAILP